MRVPALVLPLPPAGGTLTGAALAILLELELGPALAAVLGHRELNTVVLAAAIAHGAGVDGWGPERSQVSPGRRPGPGQAQSTSCRKTPGPPSPSSFLSTSQKGMSVEVRVWYECGGEGMSVFLGMFSDRKSVV